jgi:hypothetical protein
MNWLPSTSSWNSIEASRAASGTGKYGSSVCCANTACRWVSLRWRAKTCILLPARYSGEKNGIPWM